MPLMGRCENSILLDRICRWILFLFMLRKLPRHYNLLMIRASFTAMSSQRICCLEPVPRYCSVTLVSLFLHPVRNPCTVQIILGNLLLEPRAIWLQSSCKDIHNRPAINMPWVWLSTSGFAVHLLSMELSSKLPCNTLQCLLHLCVGNCLNWHLPLKKWCYEHWPKSLNSVSQECSIL